MIRGVWLLLVPALLVAPLLHASPNRDVCAFYLEREKHSGCGPSGYYLRFGHKFCSLFAQHEAQLSPNGRAWMHRTRECLIQELAAVGGEISCHAVPAVAAEHHLYCYEVTRHCDLSIRDRAVMMRLTSSHLREAAEFLGLTVINARCVLPF